MAAQDISVQRIAVGGEPLTYTTIGSEDGATYKNSARAFLLLEAGVSGTTVTINTVDSFQGLALSDKTISLAAAGDTSIIGPLAKSLYEDADGFILVKDNKYNQYDVTSTATAGGAATLTDSTKTWDVDFYTGASLAITGGTGQGQTRTVASNTATELTVTVAWDTEPDATSDYTLTGIGATKIAVLSL